ncbi:neurofilament heavy polypeptide [Stegastes partitus]|uniref:Neurofilament heavy polypeptide n=1 Tax=Stegastes partitus TaxID=144197 RepID=A0A9Y4JI88_9TELE|nr:PREDICTED: BRCA1-A complex subunit RAP80 [Stegastes partitus]
MRGRRGPSSSAGIRQQSRMSLRKQIVKDVHSESQQTDENTQEDDAATDRDDTDELSASLLPASSAREHRLRERENKSKEMTEEEMMDLALRLSEQEASVTALRRRQEEEAVMKAIEESMVDQSQERQASQSQTLLADASLRFCPRRKLSYSNGKKSAAVGPETNLNSGAGDENNWNKKRKRKAGSPLPEMPDLSQKICSQASPCSSECPSAHPDSPQSSDSTQIDDCQLRKSPVFPSTGSRAKVHVSRLTQDLLDTCRNSGFVLCSQDSWASTQIPAQPKSPTFPESDLTTCPKSPVFPEADKSPVFPEADKSPVFPEADKSPVFPEADKSPVFPEADKSPVFPEADKSPVFGRNTQRETSPSACKPQVSACSPKCENSGFAFSSQESLTSTVRPKSPVFPRSPGLPGNPIKPHQGPTEQSRGRSGSPALGRTVRHQEGHSDVQEECVTPSVSREDANDGGGSRVDGLDATSPSSRSDELNEKPKEWNCSEPELTSDMTLVWSDEDDDDATQAGGSPSPVFPEERPRHRAESQTASLSHLDADSSQTNRSLNPQRCRQSSSDRTAAASSCTGRGAAGRTAPPSGDPAGGQAVHYYWGVPFCPRGLDPDRYTQVILAQMEVYEKSLKQAQRCLLRKAEWGEAVLPQPEKSPSPELLDEAPQQLAPQRRGLRLRGQKPSEAAEEEEEEEEERRETENREEEEEEKNDGDEGPVDVDDCEVCPETPLSDATQDLTEANGAEVSPQPPPQRSESPDVEMILGGDSPAADEPPPPPPEEEEEMEVDAPPEEKAAGGVDPAGPAAGPEEVKEDRGDLDVEEVMESRLQRSASPELELAVVPRSPETAVDCPICQASFPASQIEMHAAYCDGEAADRRRPAGSQASLKPRRKRTRRAEATVDETNEPSNSGRNPEKCYICQKNVPLRDYSRHTELCFQRRASKAAAKGNLLSALEQTESRDSDAGPSGSKPPPGDVIDLRDDDDDDEEGEASAFRVSSSPIRSFTSISEATDCLVDFRKQRRAAKPSQRRR